MTNSIDDLGQAEVMLVIGSNTTEAHPIIGIELKKAAQARHASSSWSTRARIPLVDHAEQLAAASSPAPTSRSSTP